MRQHEAFHPLSKVAFDYIGPIPESIRGKRFILVAVDVYSRYVHLKAMKRQDSTSFTRYLSRFCGIFGAPRTVVTDNARNFDNTETKQLESIFNIKHIYAAPRHSRGNAPAERAIQSVEDKINTLISSSRDRLDWEAALPIVGLSMNTRKCRSTQFTPFELMFGRPYHPIQASLETQRNQTLSTEIMRTQIEEMHAEAIENSSEAHLASKKTFDASRRVDSFPVGNKVLCKGRDRRAKLSRKFEGPYEVVGREDDIYQLKDHSSGRVVTRHISQLNHILIGKIVSTAS